VAEPLDSRDAAAVGAQLRAARERRGMSAQQAAEQMHCDLRIVEALDAGRFDALGAAVYARGHLRRYAELVGEPAEPLLAGWARFAPGASQVPDLTRIPRTPRVADPRRLHRPLAFIGAALAFGLAIWWVLQGTPIPGIRSGAEVPASASTSKTSGNTSTPDQSAPTAAAAEPATAALGTPPVAPPMATPPDRAKVAAATAELGVRARADCWIEIHDAADRQLYFNLARAGSTLTIAGAPPLRVLLGNVPGVGLTWNGEALQIPGSVRRGNMGYFRLAQDGSIASVAPR
jgi:cytoskeleton protein RodZ